MEKIFRTPVTIPVSPLRLNHLTKILCIGSCFTEHIGGKLAYYRFPVDINPTGIQYNPASVVKTLESMVLGKGYTREDLERSEDLWFSWGHHGSFSSSDLNGCLEGINSRLSGASAFLRQAAVLCVSFGTAFTYVLKGKGEIVSNCHKQPAELFERRFLDPGRIVSEFTDIAGRISELNPGLRYIFTVSPVRHIKDGMPENQRSKAALHLAVRELCELTGGEYFPAYEIVMDELRDYRFYAEDMIHPNSTAIDYIWERFRETYLDESAETVCRELDPILSGLRHRPLHRESEAHGRFTESLKRRIAAFREKYPSIPLPGAGTA